MNSLGKADRQEVRTTLHVSTYLDIQLPTPPSLMLPKPADASKWFSRLPTPLRMQRSRATPSPQDRDTTSPSHHKPRAMVRHAPSPSLSVGYVLPRHVPVGQRYSDSTFDYTSCTYLPPFRFQQDKRRSYPASTDIAGAAGGHTANHIP